MSRATKESWLNGSGDLETSTVEDAPTKGESVLVRGLPAAYSNRASSQALELISGPRGEQSATVNTEKLEAIQFSHGVINEDGTPMFNEDEARIISQKYGPAFKRVVAEIDRLSGVDKEAIRDAEARFPAGRNGSAGTDDDPVSTGGG